MDMTAKTTHMHNRGVSNAVCGRTDGPANEEADRNG